MKALLPSTQRALTLSEVLVVFATLAVLAILLLQPLPHPPKKPSNQIICVNNLKEIGLGLRIFSTDNGDKFPMQLSVTNNGVREWLTDEAQLWKHWSLLSDQFNTPRFLICPADRKRQAPDPNTLTWAEFTNNSHLSYFLGLNASADQPQTILVGDRNLSTNGVAFGPGRLLLQTNSVLGFTAEIHNQAGNILLGDGSVQQVSNRRLTKAWHAAQTNSGLATNVWLVP